jgi:Spore coat polysaccharide biosynthesis protein, predicted glycosyltransferase
MREQNAEGPTLWIRADATPAMGTGHVMRCLALAQAWRDQGGAIVFFTATENRRLITRLVQEGCEVVPVPRPHPDAADRELLLQRAAACPPVWLVLDGYHFDASYAEPLRQQGVRLLVIDDTAHQKRYAADVLLNQNFGAQGLTYAGDPQAVLLLGPTYALLRREILQQRPGERKQMPDYRRLLITLGGSDPRGLTSRVIRAVGESNLRNSLIYVVIGPANPRVDDVRRQVKETEQRVVTRNLRFQVNEQADMAEIFATSDLAISAAGSTTWEILHYGIPAVLITAAANQRGIVENLSQAGYVERAPCDEDLDERGLAELIDRIIANPGATSRNGYAGTHARGWRRMPQSTGGHEVSCT